MYTGTTAPPALYYDYRYWLSMSPSFGAQRADGVLLEVHRVGVWVVIHWWRSSLVMVDLSALMIDLDDEGQDVLEVGWRGWLSF